MRVGLVSKWFASGQAVVTRHIRSALDSLGHETFVLAKPGKGPRAQQERVADPVWDQPGVTQASAADIPAGEYSAWASANGLDAVLCDQNDQFAEIAALRAGGVRTIGRFVWEHFAPEDAEPARDAYDVIYSFTRAEQERYRGFGIESPLLTLGLPPGAGGDRRAGGRAASGERRDLVLRPRQLHGQAQALPGDRRGVHRGARRPSAAADPRPGRPQGGQARAGGGRRPAGRDRARGPADRSSTCASSRAATSASRRRAGRASGCRSTRRSPSACRRSPTTPRR